jgi:hypothetical protein
MERKSPLPDIDNTGHVEWLHHNSELKWLALYQPDHNTSELASNSANVPTGEWPGQFLPMINGGTYALEKSYGHEMVRPWPRSCSFRPVPSPGWEGVLMPAGDGFHTNIIIGYDIIKTSIHRSIYLGVVLIGLHVLAVKIMDKYYYACDLTPESASKFTTR